MPVPEIRALVLLAAAVLGSISPQAAGLAHDPAAPRHPDPFARLRPQRALRPDPALSARFLPARLVADDAAQVERFRALARTFGGDSTRHFRAQGRILEVTHDLLSEMSGRPTGASGFAAYLAVRHGLMLQAGGSAHGTYSPDDTWYRIGPQWGLKNEGKAVEGQAASPGVDIGMEKVWDRFAGSDTLVVAVLDAGFSFGHPELKGRNWINAKEAKGQPGVDDDGNGYVDDSTGWDFVDDDNRPDDFHGHGTFISGVLAANFDDGAGIAGILAQGKVMPVRVLDAAGSGDQTEIAEGIRYALANGADVINFSIGGGGGSTALREAFKAARDKGVPIVAAAGNEGLNVDVEASFPSSYAYENLLIVGSHGPTGAPSDFSNFGTRVHLSAPGERVLTCGIPDRPQFWTDEFESADAAAHWSFGGGIGLSTSQPLSGTRSLAWSSGGNVSATLLDTLDFKGYEGATVAFELAFSPSDATDFLILEGNVPGTALWHEIAVIGDHIPSGSILEFALRALDGRKVRFRFRTQIGIGRNPSARVLRIDRLTLITADPAPATRDLYEMVDGTSIAAPHVAAFVGLQRLACDRMGIPWTRAKALEGILADPRLTGKSSTGGRLDAAKGLEFYLSTLPGLVVTDSTALSWTGGQKVEYSMRVSPQPGPDYRFQVSGLSGSVLDTAAGRISWVPMRPGSYSMKLVAAGPTQLRRRLALRVLPPPPLSLAAPGASTLLVGGRPYRLPAGAFGSGVRGLLEISGADAAGRTKILKTARLSPRDAGLPVEIPVGAARLPYFRVRLDGADLPPGK